MFEQPGSIDRRRLVQPQPTRIRRYSSSRRWYSSARLSPEQRLKTSTCCPHLNNCRRTSRPFLNCTASRYWYASALKCTNVTSSVACTSNCRCRSLGISHKSKRAPGGTQTAGVCLDQNRHQDALGDVRPRAPVGKRKTINCSPSAA